MSSTASDLSKGVTCITRDKMLLCFSLNPLELSPCRFIQIALSLIQYEQTFAIGMLSYAFILNDFAISGKRLCGYLAKHNLKSIKKWQALSAKSFTVGASVFFPDTFTELFSTVEHKRKTTINSSKLHVENHYTLPDSCNRILATFQVWYGYL